MKNIPEKPSGNLLHQLAFVFSYPHNALLVQRKVHSVRKIIVYLIKLNYSFVFNCYRAQTAVNICA